MDPIIFNQLSTSMSEDQVLAILGTPLSISHSHGAKLLHYRCVEKSAYGNDIYISYGVLLRDEMVVAYGRHITFANDPVRWPAPKNVKR
jgi:hypothetical protein